MHPREDHAALPALDVEHALVAQHICAIGRQQQAEQGFQPVECERTLVAIDERAHVVGVLVIDVLEELRLNLEDRVQIEPAEVENVRDLGASEVDFLDRCAMRRIPRRHLIDIAIRQACRRTRTPTLAGAPPCNRASRAAPAGKRCCNTFALGYLVFASLLQ